MFSLCVYFLGPIDEKMFQALKEEGNQLVKDKNYKDAISKYNECLKINSKACAIYTNRQVLCDLCRSLNSVDYFIYSFYVLWC
jgi:Fe-S-cluster containining protein